LLVQNNYNYYLIALLYLWKARFYQVHHFLIKFLLFMIWNLIVVQYTPCFINNQFYFLFCRFSMCIWSFTWSEKRHISRVISRIKNCSCIYGSNMEAWSNYDRFRKQLDPNNIFWSKNYRSLLLNISICRFSFLEVRIKDMISILFNHYTDLFQHLV